MFIDFQALKKPWMHMNSRLLQYHKTNSASACRCDSGGCSITWNEWIITMKNNTLICKFPQVDMAV
jgi:hypothetical protein